MSCGIALFTPEGAYSIAIPCVWFGQLAQDDPDLLIVPGDIVQNGNVLSEWHDYWWVPLSNADFAQTTPVLFARGNHDGEHALVLGPPRTGRTSALAAIGAAARTAGAHVVVVADRPGKLSTLLGLEAVPAGSLDETLEAAAHEGRHLLLVDDAVGNYMPFDPSRLRHLVLARAEPTAVGMSPIGGLLEPCAAPDDFGVEVTCGAAGNGARPLLAPISPG